MNFTAQIRQRPVGQGGLCEGWLSDRSRLYFRWVYDCGSNQSQALNREINRIGGPIDLLFLSHLDNDHVNGADALLATRDTTEVVLPYLNDDETILLMAAAASVGALSGSFLNFAVAPAAWLLGRGVRRVTFIGGGDDGEDPDPDAPRFDKPPPDVERTADRGEGLRRYWSAPGSQSGSGNVQELPAGAALHVLGASGSGIWTLLPQAHRPSQLLLAAFRRELVARFGGLTPPQAAQAARTASGRQRLTACFEKVWSDHNLISLSLYSGPHQTDLEPWETDIWSRPHQRIARGIRWASGWISTGDAKLSVKARRKSFHHFFQHYLATTAVLVTPHHGAATSWDDDVLEGFDRLRVGCAAYGENGYGHPNRKVIDAVKNRPGARFVGVTDEDRSDLLLDVRRI